MRSHNEVAVARLTVMLAVCMLVLPSCTTESEFLTDYSKLHPITSSTGTDLVYTAPDAFTRMADYTAVLIDWPEIHFSADSEYRGMKPQDIDALAKIMRDTLKSRIEAGGEYTVVAKPGNDVLFIRTALTELYLKKKKRPVLAYTPVGAVVKVGTDALKETLEKFDIIEMALEAEFADSQSGEVLAALVVERGGRKRKAEGQKEQRMNVDEFRAAIHEYGERLRCRLDNARVPEPQWIDCTNPQAREGRESAGT
jgi:Protein of unknown function (DUF3313)